MTARIELSGLSSNSASVRGGITNCGRAGAATGAAGPGPAAAAGRGDAAADSTSRRTIRPPGPVPLINGRSTPDCAATLRASGEALTLPPAGAADGDTATIGTTAAV